MFCEGSRVGNGKKNFLKNGKKQLIQYQSIKHTFFGLNFQKREKTISNCLPILFICCFVVILTTTSFSFLKKKKYKIYIKLNWSFALITAKLIKKILLTK